MQITELLKTSEDLQSKRTADRLTQLMQELRPEEKVGEKTLQALNAALKKQNIKGGEVKEITKGELWQFQDAYKYIDQCNWHCGTYRSCKFKGMTAWAEVIDGKLKFEYVGCGRFFALKRLVEWAYDRENKNELKAIKANLGKEPEDLLLEEWKAITGNKFWMIANGRDAE